MCSMSLQVPARFATSSRVLALVGRQLSQSLPNTVPLLGAHSRQVLADSPEVSVHAEPLAFEVDLVHLPGGGYAVQGRTFTATLG